MVAWLLVGGGYSYFEEGSLHFTLLCIIRFFILPLLLAPLFGIFLLLG